MIKRVLLKNKLPMVCINTGLGPEGYFRLAAEPGMQMGARKLIDQAINVVVGLSDFGAYIGKDAETTYRSKLQYACEPAALDKKRTVIDLLNPRVVPNCHKRLWSRRLIRLLL